jgi:ferrous iron transport protein B
MDLPAYKKPLFGYDFKMVLGKVWDFITGAGKIIFIVSIIIWFLSYFGPKQKTNELVATDVHLDHSYLAKMGKGIEPLSLRWATTGKWSRNPYQLCSQRSFCRNNVYFIQFEDDAPEVKVIDKMRRDVKPNGEKVFSFATGISVLLFMHLQCSVFLHLQ